MTRSFPLIVLSILLATSLAVAQNDGIPQFSVFDSHQVDSINLQNLTINITTPVYSKSGAYPFIFTLNGSSNCDVHNGGAGYIWWACGIGVEKSGFQNVLTGLGPSLTGAGTNTSLASYYAKNNTTGSSYLCPDGTTSTSDLSGWVIEDGKQTEILELLKPWIRPALVGNTICPLIFSKR